MAFSVTLPDSNSTGMIDKPIAISYEIICALERSPPSSEYLLFELQPAMVMPYTPSDDMASVKMNPTGRSAIENDITPHGVGSGAANGITAQLTSAVQNAIAGASMKSTLLPAPGDSSSFMKFFNPSAAGCSSPPGPVRLGP